METPSFIDDYYIPSYPDPCTSHFREEYDEENQPFLGRNTLQESCHRLENDDNQQIKRSLFEVRQILNVMSFKLEDYNQSYEKNRKETSTNFIDKFKAIDIKLYDIRFNLISGFIILIILMLCYIIALLC